MAILIWILLVIFGATTEIASRATFAIPTLAIRYADLLNALRVNDLLLHDHISLLESLHDRNRDMRHIVLVSESTRSDERTHMTSAKLLGTTMAEFDERTVFKLLQVPWLHEQLTAVSAFA